jgi:hypothetical protein
MKTQFKIDNQLYASLLYPAYKRNHLYNAFTFIAVLALSVMLASCPSPGGSDSGAAGEITINFADNGAKSVIDPKVDGSLLKEIEHLITLTGSGRTITHTLAKGETSAKISVATGLWNIKADAFYEGILFRSGAAEKPVEVKAGQTASARITMNNYIANIYAVNNQDDWDNLSSSVTSSAQSYIVLMKKDVTVEGAAGSYFNCPDVTFIGNDYTMTLDGSGSLLYIGSGQKVTIRDLHLKGHSDNNASLVTVNNSQLIMQGSSSISGNTNNNSGGGVLVVAGGSFIMEGSSSVYGNESSVSIGGGGGVYVASGSFVMKDNAEVYGNTSANAGGGVYAFGAFQIESGTVYGSNETDPALRNNAASGGGAALCIGTGGTAKYGTFSGGNWVDILPSTANTAEDTIMVINGVLQP